MAGYDTAGEIQNTYASAHDEFGADPQFWVRYFNPSPAADLFENDPVPESQGAWDSGAPYIGCISAPYQSDLSGSAAQGQADAQAYAAALLSAYEAVGPLQVPSNNELWCFLDQEYSTSLSSAYWNAWSYYIAEYNFYNAGTYPLYPCLYCDPYSPYPNCSTIGATSGVEVPVAVWSSEPEPCGSLNSPPGWDADACSAAPTLLWQFGEQGACGYSANVDLDMAAPGYSMSNYCFYLSSNP
jgi:hypothetical protein